MKKKFLTLALSFVFISLMAQSFEWAKREGLWAYDYGYGIANDKSGNVYLAGKYELNANFSGTVLPCQGNHDIYVAKYSPSGALTWIRSAGGVSGDYAHCLACDGSYVYIAGEIEGSGNVIKFVGSSITLTPQGGNDVFLAKYDLNGNLLWAKRAGGGGDDKALGISYDNAGNIYICGYFNGSATFSGTTITGYGGNDIFIAKYDANGNFLWAKKAGSSGRDEALGIKCDAAGNAYVCGMFKGSANFSGQTATAPNGYWNMFLAKYGTDGTLLWLKTAGGNYDDVGWGVTLDDAGNVYVTGEFISTINFGGISLTSSGKADVFVISYNSAGTLLWARKAGGPLIDRARGIGCDGTNIYITGQFGATGSFGSTTLNAVDSSDIFTACLNSSGTFLWANSVGGAADAWEPLGYESGDAICAEASGNVYVTGALLNGGVFGNTTLKKYERTDVFLTKIKTSGTPPPACAVPSGLTAGSITTTSAILQWSAISNALSYDVQYRITGTSPWTTVNSSTNSFAISGLTPITTYEFQVRATCASAVSGYTSTQTFTTTGSGAGIELISAGASWKYLDNGTNQGTAWKAASFNDATWNSGNAELGYGDGGEATVVSYGPSSTNKYITTYFRRTFDVIDKSTISGLELNLIRDDGAVVYINGVEVYRTNLPSGTIYYNTLAPTYIDGVNESTWVVASLSSSSLVNGSNVIAVEIHQNAVTSSDISFNLKLKTLSGALIRDLIATEDSPPTNTILENKYDMLVYPNPNTGKFNLELCIDDLAEKTVVIEVTNSLGQAVYKKLPQKINGCVKEAIELDSSLPIGLYIMKVTIDDMIQTSKMLLTK